jgi:rhodanese-related sulfurtransferase
MIRNLLLISVMIFLAVGIVGCGNAQNDDSDNTASAETTASDEALTEASTEGTPTVTVNTIDGEKAMDMMASGDPYTLVDVRTQAEYDDGHIEGALLLPIDQLETLATEQLSDKDAIILVYCRSGNRSAQASALLVELGYTNVFDFGGIIDWPGEIVKK